MQASDQVDWPAAQAAVAGAAARLSAVLRSIRHPDAPALGHWSLTEVAAHVSHALDAVTAVANGGGGVLSDVWGLSVLSEGFVNGESERGLPALADRIQASATRFLAMMGDARDDSRVTWLVQGIELPLSTLTCHVLNELTVHGRDIALAEGVSWPIARTDASLILRGFLFPVLGALGRPMVDQEAAAGIKVSYDVRLRGGGRAVLRFDDGDFSVAPGAPDSPVDCHLSVDPAAFLLVAWGRINQWRAIARGQLWAWGRRPWMGVKLRSLLRNP